MNQRKSFIQTLVSYLEGYDYAYLKYVYDGIDSIPESSDIDLFILKKDLKAILSFVRENTQGSVKVVNKSFMSVVSIYFDDGSFLSLDLIHQFKQTSKTFLKIDSLKDAILSNGQVKVLKPAYDFQYTCLFYVLNKAEVPLKYQELYFKLSQEDRNDIIQTLNENFQLDLQTLHEFFANKDKYHTKVHASLASKNAGITGLFNKLNYIVDTIRMMGKQKGLTITFSGVDGAGKTTILTKVKEMVEEKYRQPVKVLRHRPSLLPILSAYQYGKEAAEKKTTERLPRTGGNKSTISSLIRFAYYFVDYIFGQFVVLFKYNMRGVTVIYDRYYFDFINDGKRSNIVLPRSFTKPLYSFLVKPDLNFFLYADADVILKRKQELAKEDIEELNEKYISLFEAYSKKYSSSKYIPINNIDIDETMDIIETNYKAKSK